MSIRWRSVDTILDKELFSIARALDEDSENGVDVTISEHTWEHPCRDERTGELVHFTGSHL